MSLTPAFLDELRGRTLLSALIGRTVKLQRAGREFKACCPFHDEKSPSFYVNDDKGFYHCFGCGAHGDAIRWMTEQRGLAFIDAVKELAQAAGIEVPAADPRAAQKQERAKGLHDVMVAAQAWFEEQLGGSEGAAARTYLQRRQVDDRLRRGFGFGYAPDARGKLRTALRDFGDALLIEAGLLISVDGKEPYDRFRGRLTIPIRDPRGRVIAFGGRILDTGEPKYLNSPDTPLFDKGRTLFNLDRASPAARKAARLIVVEGYMDVVGLARAGIDESVAPLGTALTEAQLERLWRIDPLPILCFDGDAAGQKAAIRAAERALPHLAPDRSLRFVTLPAGKDPDDIVRDGGAGAIEALMANPEPLVERLWRHERDAEPLETPEARAGLAARLQAHAQAIGDAGVRHHYAQEFRRRCDALFAPPPRAWQPRANVRFGRSDDRRPWALPARPASDELRAIGAAGIEQALGRAIMSGLIAHPDCIAPHAEALAHLRFSDRALEALRHALLDHAFDRRLLEANGVATILAVAGTDTKALKPRESNGLAFSFLRGDADPDRARRDLGEAIEVMVARPEIGSALARATAALKARMDEAALAEQQRLRAALDDTERRLMDLIHAADGL